MMRDTIALALLLALSLATPLSAADEGLLLKEYLDRANAYLKDHRHLDACETLKEATKLGGAKHPSLHMRLGNLYYGLGLIPESIAEGEKAVALAPSSKWYKYDLAKFYYVDKHYVKAEEQFINLLRLDPGFTLGYYYLAELYFLNKEYDVAWLSCQRARLLGHRGKNLEEKLAPHTTKPTENFTNIADKNILIRFMKLSSEEEAKTILDEISKGKPFENLELDLKNEKIGEIAFGVMHLKELPDAVAESMRAQQLYAPPVIMKTGRDFRIMQRIAPFDPLAWRAAIDVSSTTPKEDREDRAEKTPADATTEEGTETKPIPAGNGKEQLATQLAAYYALESWKNAWQAGDVTKYFAAYSRQFIPPDNMDLAAWKRKRTASLARPKFIHLTIKDPVVELLTDNHLLITFMQSFESDTYQDTVIKILTMVKEEGRWKISDERSAQDPFR